MRFIELHKLGQLSLRVSINVGSIAVIKEDSNGHTVVIYAAPEYGWSEDEKTKAKTPTGGMVWERFEEPYDRVMGMIGERQRRGPQS